MRRTTGRGKCRTHVGPRTTAPPAERESAPARARARGCCVFRSGTHTRTHKHTHTHTHTFRITHTHTHTQHTRSGRACGGACRLVSAAHGRAEIIGTEGDSSGSTAAARYTFSCVFYEEDTTSIHVSSSSPLSMYPPPHLYPCILTSIHVSASSTSIHLSSSSYPYVS